MACLKGVRVESASHVMPMEGKHCLSFSLLEFCLSTMGDLQICKFLRKYSQVISFLYFSCEFPFHSSRYFNCFN